MLRIAVALALLTSLCQAQTISFATIAPEGSSWMKVMRGLDRELTKKTGGKVKLKFFAGALKGDETSVIEQMQAGAVDAAGFAGLGMGEISGEIRALDLPLLVSSDEEVDYLYDKLFDRFAEVFEKKGYILLGLSEIGFVHIFSKQPVTTLADLKKTKCWAWSGDAVAETALKHLGVSPVPLSLADVLVSLQTGMIDTIYSPPMGAIAMQWFTKVNYFQEYPLSHSTGGLVITKRAFNTIRSAEHREALKTLSRRYTERLIKLVRKENQEAIEALKKAGLKFIPKPGEVERKQYDEIGKQIREDLVGKVYTREVLNEVLATLDEYRKSK